MRSLTKQFILCFEKKDLDFSLIFKEPAQFWNIKLPDDTHIFLLFAVNILYTVQEQAFLSILCCILLKFMYMFMNSVSINIYFACELLPNLENKKLAREPMHYTKKRSNLTCIC
jgi:hypothetical protein